MRKEGKVLDLFYEAYIDTDVYNDLTDWGIGFVRHDFVSLTDYARDKYRDLLDCTYNYNGEFVVVAIKDSKKILEQFEELFTIASGYASTSVYEKTFEGREA